LEQKDVGAVGARLLYPDHRVQHCGVVIGLGGAAGHLFVGLDENAPGYLDLAVTTRECSGVTGACLATRRDIFEEHGRFDESLGIDLNDIDYCLRLQRAGLRVLYEPIAELIHYESTSRGTAGDVRDIVRFIERWEDSILAGDPFLNPHLTRRDSSCALRDPDENEWWQRWYRGLSSL
jgi:GT2 family glycosyltransferase